MAGGGTSHEGCIDGAVGGLTCTACSSDDSDSGAPIADGPLQGVIDGKLWVFQSGETDPFLSQGEPTYFGEAYAEAAASCPAQPSLNFLILMVPRQTGSYNLSFDLPATFVVQPADNRVATKGRLVVEEIGSSIRGGAAIEFDPNNKVSGHFELKLCPWPAVHRARRARAG